MIRGQSGRSSWAPSGRPPPDLDERMKPDFTVEVENGIAREARDPIEGGCKRQKFDILVPVPLIHEQQRCDSTVTTASTACPATDSARRERQSPGGSETQDMHEKSSGQDLGRDSGKAISRGSLSPTKERAGDGPKHSSDGSRNGAHER